jgi:hypothetical protein
MLLNIPNKKLITIVLSIIFTLVIIGLAFVIYFYFTPKTPAPTPQDQNQQETKQQTQQPTSPTSQQNSYAGWKTYKNEQYRFEFRFPAIFNYSENTNILRSKDEHIIVYLYGSEGLNYYTKDSDQYCEGTSCWPPIIVKHYQIAEFLSNRGISEVENIKSTGDLEKALASSEPKGTKKEFDCGQKKNGYLLTSEENAHFMKEDFSPVINYVVIVYNNKGIFTMEFADIIFNDVVNSEMAKSFICSF